MSDLIRREDAIKILSERCEAEIPRYGDLGSSCSGVLEIIKAIPSAEPEWNRRTQSAIIHCADCRWWVHDDDTDPYGYCYACKSGTYTEHWEISIHRKYKGDFYCADAEIRENE